MLLFCLNSLAVPPAQLLAKGDSCFAPYLHFLAYVHKVCCIMSVQPRSAWNEWCEHGKAAVVNVQDELKLAD